MRAHVTASLSEVPHEANHSKLRDFTATYADNFFKELGRVLSKRTLVMIKSTLRRPADRRS